MKVSIKVDSTVLELPVITEECLTVDYGASTNEDKDSVQYGYTKIMGAESLATLQIDSFFPAKNYNYVRGSYKSISDYIKFFVDARKAIKIATVVITTDDNQTLFNKTMAIETFSWKSPGKTGDVSYTLNFEEYRIPTAYKTKKK